MQRLVAISFFSVIEGKVDGVVLPSGRGLNVYSTPIAPPYGSCRLLRKAYDLPYKGSCHLSVIIKLSNHNSATLSIVIDKHWNIE